MDMSQTKMNIEKDNNVVHPEHYNKGIEMWDYAYTHKLDFFEGNIIKYVTRWKYKNGIQDLYKAKEYLDKLIEKEEEQKKIKSRRNLQ